MRKLLIVKTGSTLPGIQKNHGDFDDHVRERMGLGKEDVWAAAVHEGEELPEPEDVSGVVITGSHSMVTDREEWSVKLAEWLNKAIATPIPILGICYGHQLLADALGGTAAYHPQGAEVGNVDICLTEAGERDPLLGVLPKRFLGYAVHSQTALALPPGAKVLAYNAFEPHHAFVLNDHIWGVQFHPEFNAGIVCSYIEDQRQELLAQGQDPDALLRNMSEHEYGQALLQRFYKLVKQA